MQATKVSVPKNLGPLIFDNYGPVMEGNVDNAVKVNMFYLRAAHHEACCFESFSRLLPIGTASLEGSLLASHDITRVYAGLPYLLW